VPGLANRARTLIPFSGLPLRRRDEWYRPFFIVGSGRSGTTLLRRILCANPGVHIPPETYVLGRVIGMYAEHDTLRWRHLVYLVLGSFEFHRQFDEFECTLRPAAQKLLDLPRRERSLARILNEIYLCHAAFKGVDCERWGDKTPSNVFSMRPITKVFPDARFVNVIRDGCDVVQSFLSSGLNESPESAANVWARSLSAAAAYRLKHPEACLDVRYEDLVRKPEETIRALCSFLEIDFVERMLQSESVATTMGDVALLEHHENVKKPLSASRVGRGRADLTPHQKARLAPILDPWLSKLGYPLAQEAPSGA